MNGVCSRRLYRHSLFKERRKRQNKKGRRYGLQPRLPFPKLSLELSLMKKKRIVKPLSVLEGAVAAERISVCLENSRLQRHGGLIRLYDETIRVGKGGYRCPCCSEVSECRAESQQPPLPSWHQDLMHYLALVSKHGIPEDDRPKQCPKCCQSKRKPHRHSHYERIVMTVTCREKICIFRFRCPDCGYVHSVIPAFLEPYMQMALDLQEELVGAAHQGATVEQIAEQTQALPCGSIDERTIASLIRGWNQRLAQLESGLWAWMLARAPHLALPRSSSLWNTLHTAWTIIREQIPELRNIRFLHGLNRLHFSMTVTAHG
jgi:hypothetical protein